MRSETAEVRIAVLEPSQGGAGAAEALARLGASARLEIYRDLAAGLERAASGEVDLAVVDLALGADADRALEALRSHGPPAVVVCDNIGDDRALRCFRLGAVDCVAFDEASDEALAVVALEHIRRWRAIREQGAVERRIRDLERYNESIIQNMNSAVIVVDAQGRITSCNPPAGQILGRPVTELIGQSVADWFPDASGTGVLARTLREGVRFKGAESAITRPGGARVPIGISCAPIATGAEPHGAVATFQDLSEIRQLQRQVLQTEKMASIGQLAAGVAHEINNPMGFIHANLSQMAEYLGDLRRFWSSVEGLRKGVDGGSPSDARAASQRLAALVDELDLEFVLSDLAKAIRESQEGSERIRHIVQDLRDFSHQDNAQRAPADLNQCLDSTANIVWPMMKHIVVLEKEYQDLPALLCYPMQLKQVFMNLLVNAYQAIEESWSEGDEPGRIQLRTWRSGDRVMVSVTDTGAGIEREDLDRIFDPFFTTKKIGSGTGLGLSTSYNIVQRHGGTIEVESERGRGSTFRVVLAVENGGD